MDKVARINQALVAVERICADLDASPAGPGLVSKRKQAVGLEAGARQLLGKHAKAHEGCQQLLRSRLKAERRLGDWLKRTVKAGKPKLSTQTDNKKLPGGVTRDQSSDWQRIAKLDQGVFDGRLAEPDPTTAALVQLAKRTRRDDRKARHVARPTVPGLFRVLYADPPWSYGSSGPGLDYYGPAERHYEAMPIQGLCELTFDDGRPVRDIMEPDSVLFLWVTSPMLEDAFRLISAWGFKYKTSFVWDKVKHNFGHYNSVRHELLLVCTRGSCTPEAEKLTLYDSVVEIERSGKHSEKPEEFRQMIDAMYPNGRRIELFARRDVEGWESWGSEK